MQSSLTQLQLTERKLILFVNDAAFFLSHRLPLARRALDEGMQVIIAAAPDPVSERKIREYGFKFEALPLRRTGKNIFHEIRLFFAIVSMYRRVRPDIVHHVTIKPVIYGGIAARLLAIPSCVFAISGLGYVFLDQSVRGKLQRFMLLPMYRMALRHPRHRVIFQNPDDLATFRNLELTGTATATVVPGGSGVDLSLFAHKSPPGVEPLRVVFPARLLRDKGLLEFVSAARYLTQQGTKAVFIIAGAIDPHNPSGVSEAEVRAWELEGVIEWIGHRSDMPQVIESADIICLPSYREGLPKVLIEAAAVGRAIVSTDVPGCRDICRHNINGLLVPAKSATELATALAKLIDNEALRLAFGRAGRKLAEDCFSDTAVADATVNIYARLQRQAP